MPALTTQTDELSGNEQLLSLVVRVRRRPEPSDGGWCFVSH